jgi:membrane protein DedA with SNARE-associated domain
MLLEPVTGLNFGAAIRLLRRLQPSPLLRINICVAFMIQPSSMHDALPFLIRHGYVVLFLAVLAEQLGLPLPATPFIIAAGALAHLGQMNLVVALLLATVASVLADLSWYQIGRLRGVKVLRLLCRISLEPDYCVRRTENSFSRHGAKTLLIAKFVPGVSTVAPPLAGINHLPLVRFIIYDGTGALLWIGSFLLLGFILSKQHEQILVNTEPGGRLTRLDWLEVFPTEAFSSQLAHSPYHARATEDDDGPGQRGFRG